MPSFITLAFWRWRHTWFLQIISTLGIVAAIVIICTVPLFADVMSTASIRSVLRTTPDSAEIELNSGTNGLSTAIDQDIQTQFHKLLQDHLGNLATPTRHSIISSDFFFASPKPDQLSLVVYGTKIDKVAPYLGKLKGKLPQVTTQPMQNIDILVTEKTAQTLKVKIGDQLKLNHTLQVEPSSNGTFPAKKTLPLTARIVGTFVIDEKHAAQWHGENFEPTAYSQEKQTQYSFTFLVPNESLLAFADQASKSIKKDAIFSASYGYTLRQYYSLNTAQISNNDLYPLINKLNELQREHEAYYGDIDDGSYGSPPTFPYLQRASLYSPLFGKEATPSSLERLRSRLEVARIPVIVLTLQIILLILFFISLMTSLLIDRQTDAIATLRSRGASSSQIFSAQLLQYMILSGIALLIGVPLAILTVYQLTQRILLPTQQDALNIITQHQNEVLQTSLLYALSIVLVTLLTMGFSLLLAARMDVLAIRRASGRANKAPLWQRFQLDLVAGVLALGGYLISLYIASISNTLQGDEKILIATPLSIIAPFFLIVGCMFLFLRLFPLLLRGIAFLMSRGQGAVSMIAMAQLSRAPRHAIRMTMLLAIAIAIALFSLVYNETQTQHVKNLSFYQTGADFSGDYLGFTKVGDITKIRTQYTNIPGVTSVSVGYVTKGEADKSGSALSIRAVDTSTFVKTVNWPTQQERQAADQLFTKFQTEKKNAVAVNYVPAIIDTTTAKNTLLKVGESITVKVSGLNIKTVKCIIVGIVPYIPSTNNRLTNTAKETSTGSIVFDYQTYVEVYQKEQSKSKQGFIMRDTPPINHVWLQSKDDEGALASIRTALKKPSLQLRNVLDRREILATLKTDPLYLVLAGVLSIGTVTTLLLALIGDLLASWISASTRRVNFAILRAIGTTPQEVIRLLGWEQVIIYTTGLLLGIGFGALLSASVIPSLTFSSLNADMSNTQFYALQSAFPVQIIIPSTLIFGLLALIAIFVLALMLMITVVIKPSINQMVRLNED